MDTIQINKNEASIILGWRKVTNQEQTKEEYDLAKRLQEFIKNEQKYCICDIPQAINTCPACKKLIKQYR